MTPKTVCLMRMLENRETAKKKAAEWNSAITSGNADVMAIDTDLRKAVDEYNGYAEGAAFIECKTDNPCESLKNAILMKSFIVLAIKETKDKEKGTVTREIVERKRDIDLLAFNNACEGKTGANPGWTDMAEVFGMLMCCKTALDIAENESDGLNKIRSIRGDYRLSKTAALIEAGETPTSNTQLLKRLTSVIQAMIGEGYKPKSHDVAFFEKAYTKRSNKNELTLVCANNKTIVLLLSDLCFRIMTGRGYNVSYRSKTKASGIEGEKTSSMDEEVRKCLDDEEYRKAIVQEAERLLEERDERLNKSE